MNADVFTTICCLLFVEQVPLWTVFCWRYRPLHLFIALKNSFVEPFVPHWCRCADGEPHSHNYRLVSERSIANVGAITATHRCRPMGCFSTTIVRHYRTLGVPFGNQVGWAGGWYSFLMTGAVSIKLLWYHYDCSDVRGMMPPFPVPLTLRLQILRMMEQTGYHC